MRSPFKGSITEFMAMGKALGSSKIKPSTAVDPSKYYTAPKKQEKKGVVKIGTITKDHIEESKKELLQQKKELREEELK